MLSTFKAEFRKLFTVRSTYIIIILTLGLTILFALFFEGYKGNTGSGASTLQSTALQEIVRNAAGLSVTFVSIIAILFMAHEYRYNTIAYTLTANARRTKVLLAKLLTISIFGVLYGLIAVTVAIVSYKIGLSFRDATLPAQDFNAVYELSKVAFYFLGYTLIGTLIAIITRSVVVAIGALMIVPITLESLLRLILKDDSKYLPFSALDSIMGESISPVMLPVNQAITVSCIYLAFGVLLSWILFTRRDAN